MTIYELKVEDLKTVEEVKMYYRKAADELITAEEDLLFDEEGFASTTIEQVSYLRRLVEKLRSRVYELSTPTLSDKVVDLYLDRPNHYTICMHDKSQPIGIIEFQEAEKDSGNLTCSMKKEYLDKSYSLRAIRLVGTELSKIGVFDVLVSYNEQKNQDINEFAGMALEENASLSPIVKIEAVNINRRRHSSK